MARAIDNATVERIDGRERMPGETSDLALLTAGQVARMLNCSKRQVYRLANEGKVPWGYMVGKLRRWPMHQVRKWFSDECRPVGMGRPR